MRIAAPLICIGWIFGSIAFAQVSDAISAASLSGLTAFNVSIGDLSTEVRQDGLKAEQVRSDIELKLRAAGIKIIPQSTSVMGVVGSSGVATKIRGEVGAETDRFVTSYLSANPPVEK